MEKLKTKISTLLIHSAKIVDHSNLTQNMIHDQKIVLWDIEPSKIDKSIYAEFELALKKKGGRSYMYNNYLPHTEFAISLLCASGYTLNHKIMPKIIDKTFASTWRAIDIISQTGTPNVVNWIRPFICGRNAVSYCNNFNISLDRSIVGTTNDNPIVDKKDVEILNSINFKPQVVAASNYIYPIYTTSESVINDLMICHYHYNMLIINKD